MMLLARRYFRSTSRNFRKPFRRHRPVSADHWMLEICWVLIVSSVAVPILVAGPFLTTASCQASLSGMEPLIGKWIICRIVL